MLVKVIVKMRVMVNGTFDIVHRGHIELLNYAKGLGDQLLVAIDTDRRVKELKGKSRPINNQEDRKYFLYNLKAVDTVMLFDSQEELIDIMKEYNDFVSVLSIKTSARLIVPQGACKELRGISMEDVDGIPI